MYIFSSFKNLFAPLTKLPVLQNDLRNIPVIAHSNGFAKDCYTPSTVSQEILNRVMAVSNECQGILCITGGNTAAYWGYNSSTLHWTEADAQLEYVSVRHGNLSYIVERTSRNTKENIALIIEEIKHKCGIYPKEVVLVTHENQLRRAVALARKMGLKVYAVPVRSRWDKNNIPWFLRSGWQFWLRETCVYAHHILFGWV